MRDIKFRAWNKNSLTMVYFDNEKLISDQYQTQHFLGLLNGIHCEGELEQFTGLQDENGVDIYEGDIALKSDPRFCSQGVIEMHNGCWMVVENEEKYFNLHFYLDEIQIIGNIHENPELLDYKEGAS